MVSAVEFPALGFNINGDHMPYDLSATVHSKLTKSGNGHYTAISRSRDLQSQQWFLYDDDGRRGSNVPNSEINPCDGDGKKGHSDGSSRDVPIQPDSEGAKKTVDICVDGEEGKADGSSDKND